MKEVVVIGGGWAGCAAAVSAKKAGAKVTLLERTDLLLGLGNVGGLTRNNGRYTAAEECILLGGRELFAITDSCSRHKNVDFPGHKHASIYDVNLIESAVRRKIHELGIDVLFYTTAKNVEIEDQRIKAIVLNDGTKIKGDCFVETTGTTGPMNNCHKYGNGCAMCILRCPTFGGRVSITEKCGIKDMMGKRKDGTYGSFSGSVKINKETLSKELHDRLNKEGVVIIPLSAEEKNSEKLNIKICQHYSLDAFADNIILLDTGHAKLMAPFYPIEKLRKIKGFENARFEDPYSGGVANSIRHLSIAPRENTMKVKGIENLFVAGEKSGFYIGHTEAIVTGYLAGHNSVRKALNASLLELPDTLATGDFIAYSNQKMSEVDGDKNKFTFAGSTYFERMKDINLYSIDQEKLFSRVETTGLLNIYDKKLC
ncbi:FAD-dependent oxidoreductase [Dendrosporobacter sp. 1207_IL3150]|uniref:FAD-dependent oxidoreductase n=1 Tax=Dendrosporobacter sp. 1207_IL3150 TaxID=3084054 RepID=UPI002FD918ED